MRVTTGYLEKVARDWQAAFEVAHGKTAPAVTWERGWFKIDHRAGYTRRYRRAALEEMTKVLRRGFND